MANNGSGGEGLVSGRAGLRCGLHRTYVSGIERGIRYPTVVILAKFAAILNTEPAELLRSWISALTSKKSHW